ncbi:MAG: aminotransferase class IV [Bacteroidales bacterium]|jgi:4-amino-4-deoxychorismate lyase|nr:aminotransferase class IV [Bacteroidales bacterium]
MSLLLETIQIRSGVLINPQYHQQRMHTSSLALLGKRIDFDLLTLPIPNEAQKGIVKCRILYKNRIELIEFKPYVQKQIQSLQMVIDNNISYSHKLADRSQIIALLKQKGEADDILIVKNGRITDTSFGNVVLCKGNEYYTPSSFLLNGTKRQQLLNDGFIKVQDISPDDLFCMDKLVIINAMLDLDSGVELNISSVFS